MPTVCTVYTHNKWANAIRTMLLTGPVSWFSYVQGYYLTRIDTDAFDMNTTCLQDNQMPCALLCSGRWVQVKQDYPSHISYQPV